MASLRHAWSKESVKGTIPGPQALQAEGMLW